MARMSADERRTRLIDAALRVMTREGVTAGTTRAIVSEAGMALSVFHYCFRSRDELIRELILRLSTVERQAVWAAMSPGTDLRQTLANAANGFLLHLEENPGDELVLFELNHHALRTPALRDLAAEQYASYYRTAEEILAGAAELNRVSWSIERPVLARMVVTILDGVTTTWLADRDTEQAREVMASLLDHVATFASSERVQSAG